MHGALIYSMIILVSAFEYNGGEPASLFPFSTAAESYSIPGVYKNPLSVAEGSGCTIYASGSRPYSEEALHSYNSGIKYSGETWGLQFSGHSFGSDFYSETRLSASAGFSILNTFSTGFTVSSYKLNIDVDDEQFSSTMYDGDIAGAVTPFKWISFAFLQNCISAAATGSNKSELYPEWSTGVLLKPYRGFTLSWNITDTAGGYINSFTAGITPSSFLYMRGGYSPEDTRFAASVTILIKKLNLTYSLSAHPYLGYTHSFGITISSSSDIETIRYNNPSIINRHSKININSAPAEDLKKIPGLCSLSAERIILYREKIGPVSEKGLLQIGLSNDEIAYVRKNCYGFVRDSDLKNNENTTVATPKKRKTYIPPKERIKERFRLMIKEGIPASTAIRYSEIPESPHSGEIESLLAEDNTISDEQKDIIRKACSR